MSAILPTSLAAARRHRSTLEPQRPAGRRERRDRLRLGRARTRADPFVRRRRATHRSGPGAAVRRARRAVRRQPVSHAAAALAGRRRARPADLFPGDSRHRRGRRQHRMVRGAEQRLRAGGRLHGAGCGERSVFRAARGAGLGLSAGTLPRGGGRRRLARHRKLGFRQRQPACDLAGRALPGARCLRRAAAQGRRRAGRTHRAVPAFGGDDHR